MKKKNIIEEIAFKMWCSEKSMPQKQHIVSDDIIINQIKTVNNLEQTDRDGRTLLINAVNYERISIVEYLLEKKVNINVADKMGFTALHFAVQNGNVDIIEMLLENGADVNAKNIYGNNPIMLIKLTHSIDVVKILVKFGANPNLKNEFGVSAMDTYAAYPNIINIFKEG